MSVTGIGRRPYLQLDVFASAPGRGNALAVLFDADDLDTVAMQSVANWLNLSETVFLLPPVAEGADYRVRIFTPRQELPFAGHPSVGAAYAVLHAGGAAGRGGRLVQECAAGLLPVTFEGDGPGRRVSVRAPRAVEHAADPARVIACLGAAPLGPLRPALMDNGPRWWCVELGNEQAVRGHVPDLAAIAAASEATGAGGVAIFARCPAEDHALVVRAFAPSDGIPEDPVTGSANAAIAALLHSRGALPSRRFTSSQGRELGRDGIVALSVDDDGDAWIGGEVQVVVEGVIQW